MTMSRFFNITTSDDVTSTIFLYGDIGDYTEVQSGRIAQELMEAERVSRRIHVRINSNGGEVYSGIAIFNALRHSQADIRIYVDGIAASMASVIALCGKPVEMSKYARLMLHSVSGGCYGNKQDLQRCMEEIESLEGSLSEIYAERLGMSKEEVEKYVSVGDSVTRERDLVEMGDCVNVKSLDNRAGCYVLIEALRAIKASKKKPSCNFVAAFTVQEEVGLRGAQAGTLDILPDFSIALDVTIACDIPGTPAHDQVSRLGEGAAIKLYDGSIIADRRMVQFMKATAEANKIKWQVEMLPAGGTDAGAMQKFVPGGSIAGAISVPTRNVHQVIEMASKSDLDAAVDLLAACAMNVDKWDWSWNSVNQCQSVCDKPAKASKAAAKTGKAAAKKKKAK